MVEALQAGGYTFASFERAAPLPTQSVVLLRHDVDFSLSRALRIAEIEADRGICANYFVHLTSPCYNLLSDIGIQSLSRLERLGHSVGLHFDVSRYAANPTGHLADELATMIKFFPGAQTQVVSFHRPRRHAQLLSALEMPAGVRSTYDKDFARDIAYFSDSLARWASRDPLSSQAFIDRSPMQILTHPLWWTTSPGSALHKLSEYLDDLRSERVEDLERTAVSLSLHMLLDGTRRG